MSSGWSPSFTWSRLPISVHKQSLACLACAALSLVTTGCGGSPSFEDLAKKVKAGETLKECEDRFWGKVDTNFAKQVGDKTYLYEFSWFGKVKLNQEQFDDYRKFFDEFRSYSSTLPKINKK